MNDKSIVHHKYTWCNVEVCHFLAFNFFRSKIKNLRFAFNIVISTFLAVICHSDVNEPSGEDSVRKVSENEILKNYTTKEKKMNGSMTIRIGKIQHWMHWMDVVCFLFGRENKPHCFIHVSAKIEYDDWIRETIFAKKYFMFDALVPTKIGKQLRKEQIPEQNISKLIWL